LPVYVAVNCNQESNGLFKRRHDLKLRGFEVNFRKPTDKIFLKLEYLNDDLFANSISLSALQRVFQITENIIEI